MFIFPAGIPVLSKRSTAHSERAIRTLGRVADALGHAAESVAGAFANGGNGVTRCACHAADAFANGVSDATEYA